MAPIKEWFGLYNVIFNWFEEKYGGKALEEYWRHIASSCYGEVEEDFREKGLKQIRDYFNAVFERDSGEYLSELKEDRLIYRVVKCPDYDFMNSSENPYFHPIKDYCRHHEVINSVLAEKAGYSFRMTGCSGQGQCTWEVEKCGDKEEVKDIDDHP